MIALFCSHADFIAHLLAENEWLKMQMVHERQRAELAIDNLLRLKVNAGPVSVPLIPDVTPEDTMERLMRDPEFSRVGE